MADLETPDPPTPPAAPAAPAPPAPEQPPVAAADPEPEGTQDVGGQRMVPLAALLEERESKRALKAKAEQYDGVVGYVNAVRPYIEFLQANPNLMTRTQQDTQPTPTTTTQPVDPKAETLARTLDLYTTDGQPDVKRAQTMLQMIDDAADAKATAKIKPVEESTVRERSSHMFQRALMTKAPGGQTPDRSLLEQLWARTDPKVTATEEGALGVVAMALGMQYLGASGAPAAAPAQVPATPPLHTEPAGGRSMNRQPVSQLEQNIAKTRGLDDKKYAELTRGFTPGRPSVLEE